MADTSVKGRFAPTPSGQVHIGNAFCYLLSWLSAKKQGGSIVLRIEDVDTPRVVKGMTAQTMEDLRWLGLDWDEGPETDLPTADYFQSARTGLYLEHFHDLKERDLTYPCFCSRADLKLASAPHAEDGHSIYPGLCSHLTEAQRVEKAKLRRPAWRVRVPDEVISFRDGKYGECAMSMAREYGDFPIRRSDGVFCYQMVAALDDSLMGVTEVIRSNDLLSSTPQQIYIQRLFGYQSPHYIHIPMILDSNGKRMTKRDKALSIRSVRERMTREEVLGRLGCLAGLQEDREPRTLSELVELFSWDKVPSEDIPLPEGMFN